MKAALCRVIAVVGMIGMIAGAAAAPQSDFILNDCQGTASANEFDGTALRAIDPSYALANALNGTAGRPVVTDLSAIKNITSLETTKHGRLIEQKDDEGLVSYYYDPITDYVGEDRAVFTADYDGKHYKIVVNLKISRGLNNDLCPDKSYQLEKVTQPSSGASSFGNDFAQGTISITFADLPSSTVDRTMGTIITLDTAPVANGELLPTSNPSTKKVYEVASLDAPLRGEW